MKSFLSAFEAIFLSFPRYRGPRRASYTRKEGEELIKENCFSCVGRLALPLHFAGSRVANDFLISLSELSTWCDVM